MKKLNIKLLAWVAGLSLVLAIGVVVLHHFQKGRIARALLWQARHAEEDGRLDLAARFFSRYLELQPGDNVERANLGRVLAEEKVATTLKAKQRALFVLEQVVTRDPDRTESRRLLVRMAMDLGRHQNALDHLLTLLKAAPKDGEVLDLLGQTYQAMGKPGEAKDSYQKAIDVAPQQVGSYERLARLLRRHPDTSGKDTPARDPDAVMDRLIVTNERLVTARLARWNYYTESGLLTRVGSLITAGPRQETDLTKLDAVSRKRLTKAEEDVARALDLAPEDAAVLLAASELQQLHGRFDAARELLQRGQRLHPQEPRLYRQQAALELQADKPDAALACLREGVKAITGRKQGELRWTLANQLLDRERPDEARQEIERLEKGGYATAALDYLNGRLLVGEGQWKKAAVLFERARAALETTASTDRESELFLTQLDLFLGRCFEQLNDRGRQMAAFNRLAARNPTSATAHLSLASAHAAAGRLDEALEQYRQALVLPETPVQATIDYARLLVLRNLQRGQRDWSAVNEALDRASKVMPDAPDVVLLRVEVLAAHNQLDDARKLLEEARAKKPKQIEFHVALAALCTRQGDSKTAAQVLADAEKQAGDSVELRLARAWQWVTDRGTAKREETSAALAALSQNRERFSAEDQRRLLEQLAAAYQRLGDTKQALLLWDQLAQLPASRNDLRVQFGLVELGLQEGNDAIATRGLDEVRRIEGGEGTLWRFGEALRLLRRAQSGDAAAQEQARGHLDAVAGARPGWIAVHVARAQLEETAGRPDEALSQYQQAVNLGERDPRTIRRLVELYNKRQRSRDAAQVIRQLKKQAPLSEDLRRLEVAVALRTHDSSNAIERALELVKPDSNDYRDCLWLGQVLAESGQRPEQAERHLRRAVALAETLPETWVVLIEFLAARNRLDDAAAEIEKARAKLSKEQADLALAQCYEAIGQPDKARQHFDAALAARPKEVNVVRNLAAFCIRDGQLRDAEQYLRTIHERKIEAAQEDVDWARRSLAWVRAATGGRQGLVEALSLVGLRLEDSGKLVLPDNKNLSAAQRRSEQQARARVLAVHNRQNFRRQAIAYLEELSREEGLSPDDQYLLAQLREADGKWLRARQEFRDLLALAGDTPVFLAHYTQSLLHRGDLEEARTCLDRLERLEQSRKVAPGSFGSARLRAVFLEARGEQDKALALLQSNVARKEARPEEVLLLIGYLVGRKRTDEAFAQCEQAWKTCPMESAASASLAVFRAGNLKPEQVSQLERWLQEAKEKSPNSTAPLLYLAELRDLQKKYTEAEALYRQALHLDPNSATALNNLAWLLAQKPEGAAESLQLINRAIEIVGPAPGLLDTRANALLASDQTSAAIKDLEEANLEAPGAPRLFQLARAHLKAKDRSAAAKALAEAKDKGFDPGQLHPLQQNLARQVAGELEAR
jgi:tetratricopeptide (TPR) repeat protein